MSSILKALKKLENEQPRQEQVQSLSGTVHSHRQKTHDARRFRVLLSKISVAGLVMSILVGGGFIGFNYVSKKKTSPVETSPIDSGNMNKVTMTSESASASLAEKELQPVENTDAAPAEKLPVVIPLPDQDSVARTETVPDPVITPLAAASRTPASEIPHTPTWNPAWDKDPGIGEQGAADGALSPEQQDGKQPVEKNVRAAIPPPVGKIFHEDASDTDTASRQIPVFPAGKGDLKLMAIAWSEDPSSRMAVINGSVVREGGAVGGVRIEKINADEVMVRKNNTSYRLVFKLK